MNNMKNIRIEKVTLNVGAGKDVGKLDKGMILLEKLTGKKPTKTVTQKRIAAWGLRPGLPVGCKVTLRGEDAIKFIDRLIYAKDNKLSAKHFDGNGNIAFGIPEYIDVKDAEYLPEIGITGFEACITLTRPGFRVKTRRIFNKKVGKHHRISKEEAIDFIKSNFKVTIEGA